MADEIKNALEEVAELVGDLADDLRPTAFGVVLAHLLKKTPAPKGEPEDPEDEAPSGQLSSLPELIALKKPKKHPQYIACFAYHSFRSGDTGGITTKEMEAGYSAVRQNKPANYSDAIGACVRRGWLLDAPQKDSAKAWLITPLGEEAVVSGFSTKAS